MSPDHFTVGPPGRVLLDDLGISLPGVLRRARLPAVVYGRQTVELDTAQFYAFWRALDEEAADGLLPIRVGQALRPEIFDPPLFSAFCSPDLTVAAARLATYKRLIGPLRLEVDTSRGDMTIAMLWPDPGNAPPALMLMELIFWVALARIATRTDVRPLRFAAPVETTPAQATAYREYLGAPIERAPVPVVTAELAVSARTLQRRLRLEGTSFQAVLRDTREALARHYLSTSRMSAGEISYLLGYDDTNSFYRAFHAWTGRTPDQVRTGTAP